MNRKNNFLITLSTVLMMFQHFTINVTASLESMTCSPSKTKSSWDALLDMEPITYTVSTSPYILSVIASGGAAGDGSSVVSESQAYGVLAASLAIASMNEGDSNYVEAKNKFYGYFNGWRKMCENSNSYAYCQSPKFCNSGQLPCLPGWKHNGGLTTVEGTGAAPDGDEDAILGMIIAVKAVENDTTRPSWYDEVRIWADESCTQFLQDNTVLSTSRSHRLVKLGSCWGGWEADGNNPSYHAPGHYRAMRDFQLGFEGRSYTIPSLGDSLSLEGKWNMLIDTSYKFLQTTQCPDTGLVPNWALVKESSASELAKHPGSFSGSGTPQYEFGAEASRTMWRIAVDAIMYPSESMVQSRNFLSPLHSRMVQYFNPTPTDTISYFGDGTLKECSPIVNNVFGSWWWNGFIFGPVLSTLSTKIPNDSFQGKSFSQQIMIDVACDKVNSISSGTSYYPRSWQVLSTMTLNGDVEMAGRIIRDNDDGSAPTAAPTVAPTPSTTNPPTTAPVCKSWCKDNAKPWEKKCTWVNCAGCDSCGPPDTSSPTSAPTPSPTTLSTPSPTSSPTPVPTTSDGEFCCSWNLFNCGVDSWCNTSEDNCHGSCGGTWIKKASKAMTCLAKWQECTNRENSCCGGLGACKGTATYKQCVDA